jgi:hypothetical protein
MEIEAPHEMHEVGYQKAHHCHQCYSVSPVVECLKSCRRVVAIWMTVHRQSHLKIFMTIMSWHLKSVDSRSGTSSFS